MWEIVVMCALVALLLIQSVRVWNLKKMVDSANAVMDSQAKHIVDEVKTSGLLRQSLTESRDKVESLKVELDAKNKLIETLKNPPKSESTQYPVAPPDLTKKSPKVHVRDKKGHFRSPK